MAEEEHEIFGFPHYTITLTNVKVRSKYTSKFLIPQINGSGYPCVLLSESGRTFNVTLHKLVVRARGEFVTKGMIIDHVDGNKENPNSSNLEVITHAENERRARALGLKTPATTAVCRIDKDLNVLEEYPSIKLASEATGCNASEIGSVCAGRRIHIDGVYWRYKADPNKTIRLRSGTKPVQQLDLKSKKVIKTFHSASEAARALGINGGSQITAVCKEKKPHAAGYGWRYAPIVKTAPVSKMPPDVNTWKQIKGYPEYRISRMGRVYSTYRNIFMKPSIRGGYYAVNLSKGGIQKAFYVHRLVAIAYIERVHGKPFVNHKDGDKLDNDVANLEWCTQRENALHAAGMGLTPNCRQVVQLDKQTGVEVARFPSMAEAKRQTGVNDETIRKCCEKRLGHKTAGGYMWRYADDTTPIIAGAKWDIKTRKGVVQFDPETESELARYDCIQSAVKATGTNRNSIRDSCNSPKNLVRGGYFWGWA